MNAHSSKKVLITGAQGALGGSVVRRFLSEGWRAIGTRLPSDSTHLSPHSKTDAHEHPSGVSWLEVDLADPKSVRTQFSGQVFDAWIHCAGGFRYASVESLTDEDFEFLLDANLKSAFFLARELVPGMKKQNFGRIVFISSRATLQPSAGMAAYAATKAGLNMLTASLAEETKAHDITVNALLPSVIDTPANRKDMPQSRFSDWVAPDQLAEIILSLVSPWGKPIHGALIPVSGRV